MRYARNYAEFKLGITSHRPTSDPYGWRNDPAERGFRWSSDWDWDHAWTSGTRSGSDR